MTLVRFRESPPSNKIRRTGFTMIGETVHEVDRGVRDQDIREDAETYSMCGRELYTVNVGMDVPTCQHCLRIIETQEDLEMARCSNCETFVPYGDPVIEVENEDVDDEGNVEIEIRLALTCANCTEEIKETTLEMTGQVDIHEHYANCPAIDPDNGEEVAYDDDSTRYLELTKDRTWSVDSVDTEATDDRRPKFATRTMKDGTVKTKPTPYRFQRQYYGVVASVDVCCSVCDERIQIELSDDQQASAFDDM
jgi:hypothetical protein